ncbi:MAG: mechanosensitive ion channel domain-containing protein [Pseudomonadota bacterium]
MGLGFSSSAVWSAEADGTSEQSEAIYSSLANVLENEQAREQLVRELRRLSAGDSSSGALQQTDQAGETAQVEVSIARRIADSTRAVAQRFVDEFSGGMSALRELSSGGTSVDMDAIVTAGIHLLLVVLATVAFFLVMRGLARPLFSLADRWACKEAGGSALLRKLVAVIAAALTDAAVIVIAYVGGYLLALFAIGEYGTMDARQSLFLNAFLLVEVFKSVLRAVFAPRTDGLRMLPLTADLAAYWSTRMARLIGFIGYGMLLVVPMASFNVSPAVGSATAVIVMGLAFLYALVIILQNKVLVSEQLDARARGSSVAFNRVLLSMFAKSWHLLAIIYFATLVVVTVTRPEEALPFLLRATLQTLLAIGAGVFISVVLSQLISRGFHVTEQTRHRYPLLEDRLNSFIPNVMKAIRLIILVVVVGFIADAWALFNLPDWIASDMGARAVGATVSVIIIVTLAMMAWIGLASWIEQRLNPETGSGEPSAREKTLLTIFRNAIAITLIIMTLMIVLAEIGINIGPLIAGAGVLGLAIGFGAQKLVQDIITGVFIQLENAINAGDVVTAAGISGTAERLTIRSLGIRDLSGTYHLIPFSSVDTVSNYMREYGFHVGEYGVAYREDIDEVIQRLREAFAELISDPEQKAKILDDLEVHGVTALADSSVNIRVRIKTLPGAQWGVGRAYNRLVKYHLDAAGIEIPFPHMTMYFGQDKNGGAPPAPVLIQSASSGEHESGQS